jgi:hypothetical protein
LNTTWRRVSQQPQLFAHHLSQCQSYSASHPPISEPLTEDHLPLLRKTFALEVKRNLFEAYLRPRETVINLVSTSISSSAAFPGGEAFHFAFSPKGQHVLAYSSSRIYVICTAEEELSVKREFKILRRPASVTILDDGSLLAVLSTDHQVDVYDLTEAPPKHKHTLALVHPPRTISLAPTGSVLAAAYDAGVEVYSLASTASATDRRAVKCDAVDSLSFSQDGTQLLGTTLHSKNPSTVILTAPYFDPGDSLPEDSVSQLWTTSILFPHSSRDCSHAVLLPSPMDDEASWTFTYDRVFETFRAVRIDDLRNGTTYFPGPIPDPTSASKLLPSTLPTATDTGDLVAAGFQGKDIWLYGVPEGLGPSDEANQSSTINITNEAGTPTGSLARSNSAPSVRSHTWPRDSSSNRIPQWQLLCDKLRNNFVHGCNITSLQGISALKWVSGISGTFCNERLVVVAPGVVGQSSETEDDGIAPVDGGRLSLLDFAYRVSDGGQRFLTIEVGENEPEILEEEHRDMETEVAIVRRRTVAQRGERTNVGRSATIAGLRGQTLASTSRANAISPLPTIPPMPPIPRVHLNGSEDQPETASIASLDEAQEALDAPYAHGSPRSAPILRRAATAARINRQLHPPRIVAQEQIQFRRADGREEHPHESDADNWVPPPPPYSKDPVAPLPEHLRNAVFAGAMSPPLSSNLYRSSTQRSSGSADSDIINSLRRSRTTYVPASGTRPRPGLHRRLSDPTSPSASDESRSVHEPVTRANLTDFDDLYDVSPPDSPEPERARPVASATALPGIPAMPSLPYAIPRRPVAASMGNPPNQEAVPDAHHPHEDVSPPEQPVVNLTQESPRTSLARIGDLAVPSPDFEVSRPSTSSSLIQAGLEAPESSVAREGHRPDLPPSTLTDISEGPSPEEPVSVVDFQNPSSSIETENIHQENVSEPAYPADFSGPSAEQLARLNSRSRRPPSQILTNPSRRGSGTFQQPNIGPYVDQNYSPQRGSTPTGRPWTNLPQSHGVYGSGSPSGSTRSFVNGPDRISPSRTPPRHGNQQGYNRPPSSSTQNLRPRMQRLETIHSVASQGALSTLSRGTSLLRRPSRATSRAERSAALNIQQAKRRGWGGTRKDKKKKKKKTDKDGVSSAGWTDVSRDSFGEEGRGKKKGTRCVVM